MSYPNLIKSAARNVSATSGSVQGSVTETPTPASQAVITEQQLGVILRTFEELNASAPLDPWQIATRDAVRDTLRTLKLRRA